MKKEGKLINIRAFAILSVVMGHSIILYSKSWNLYQTVNASPFLNMLKKIITMYEMPLFFSLSGYLFYYTCLKKKNILAFVKDKFLRLIIPFVCVSAFGVIPMKMFLHVKGFIKPTYLEKVWNTFTKL